MHGIKAAIKAAIEKAYDNRKVIFSGLNSLLRLQEMRGRSRRVWKAFTMI